jgi:hypothetical protein
MPAGYKAISTFNPQQAQAFQQLLGSLGGTGQSAANYWQELLSGNSESYDKFAAPYLRQFNEQIVPGIAERFAGVGGLSSSGFQNALGQAGAGLSENLASLREGLRGNAASQSIGSLQNLLGMQTQAFVPKQMGFLKQLLLGLGGGIGQGIGSLPRLFG